GKGNIFLENIIRAAKLWHKLRENNYEGVKAVNYIYAGSEDLPVALPEDDKELQEKGLTSEQIDFLISLLYKPKEKWVPVKGIIGMFEKERVVIKEEVEKTVAWENPKEFVNTIIAIQKYIEELRKPKYVIRIGPIKFWEVKGIDILKLKHNINIPKEGYIPKETMQKLETLLFVRGGQPGYELRHPERAAELLVNSYVLGKPQLYLFILGVLSSVGVVGLIGNLLKRFRRKKDMNKLDEKKLRKIIKGANPTANEETIDSVIEKLIVLRTLNNGQLPKEQQYIYLALSDEEQQLLNQAIENGYLELRFDDKYDPKRQPRAPPEIKQKIEEIIKYSPQLQGEQLANQIEQSLQNIDHPYLITILYLIKTQNLSASDISKIIKEIPKDHENAMWLQDLYNAIIQKVENDFISDLEKIDSQQKLKERLSSLPPTSFSLFLKYCLEKGIVDLETLKQLRKDNKGNIRNTYELAREIVKTIAQPIFDEIKTKIFAGLTIEDEFGNDILQKVFESTIDEIMPQLLRNPVLIKSKKEIKLETPLLETVAPADYREEVKKRILQINPTYTNNHSFGPLSAEWQFIMYVTRKVDEMISEGESTEEIRKVLNETYEVFATIIPKQKTAMEETTTRGIGAPLEKPISEFFTDLDMHLLFQILAEQRLDIYNLSKKDFEEKFNNIFALLPQEKKTQQNYNLVSILNELIKQQDLQQTATALKKDTMEMFKNHYKSKFLGVEKYIRPFEVKEGKPVVKHGLQETKNVFKLLWWERIIRPMFSFNYWGITTKLRKILTISTITVLIVSGITLILSGFGGLGFLPAFLLGPMTMNIGATLITSGFTLPQLLFGKSDIKGMKTFFIILNTLFSLYWGEILGGTFLLGIGPYLFNSLFIWTSPITIAITAGILLLVSLPTYMSLWHLTRMIRGAIKWYQDTWSTTAKIFQIVKPSIEILISGLISFILASIIVTIVPSLPFIVVFSGVFILFSIFIPKITAIFQKIPVIGLILTFLIFPITNQEIWKVVFNRWYNEIKQAEQKVGYILPTKETTKEYLERLIEDLYIKNHLSKEERAQWLGALEGEKDKKFVKPRSKIAQEILTVTFDTLSKKKPLAEDLLRIQTLTTHIQAAGEDFAFKFEVVSGRGSFDKNTHLLGYLARNYKV
ncbi:MAG: MFS transporter, partial [Endomicrobiia bacterium]